MNQLPWNQVALLRNGPTSPDEEPKRPIGSVRPPARLVQPTPRTSAPSLALHSVLIGATLSSLWSCGETDEPEKAGEQSGGESAPALVVDIPDTLPPIEDPTPRITDLETVEELSEELANRLIEWGDKLGKRQFRFAADYLAADFLGHDLADPGEAAVTTHDLGITETDWDVSRPTVLGRDTFLERFRDFLSPLAAVDIVLPKTKGAEFSLGFPAWGALKVQLRVYGRDPQGGRVATVGYARVRVEQRDGTWKITRFQLSSLHQQRRALPFFTEVGVPAGVSHVGARFGKEGNDSFFWNGACSHDFDGDGDFDLFVPSDRRNFLYRNRGDGGFDEIAEEAGVARPGGGTGCLFFDGDGDGDQDLLVGQVGYRDGNQRVGRPCLYFVNDGEGKFTEASEAAGFTDLLVAFSLAAADVDNDGDIDVYVCGYNTEGFTAPNSWHEATNGTANALYINQGGGVFVNEAESRGVNDTRWSYAGAFADFDEDGDQDLYLANDYSPNALFVNDGEGHFEDRSVALGVEDVGNGMGACWGDLDNDGRLDLYVSNMSSSAGNRILSRLVDRTGADDVSQTLFKLAAGNSVFRWGGDGFDRVDPKNGGVGANWAWAAQWTDLENDGDDDVVCVNGFISGDSGGSFKDT